MGWITLGSKLVLSKEVQTLDWMVVLKKASVLAFVVVQEGISFWVGFGGEHKQPSKPSIGVRATPPCHSLGHGVKTSLFSSHVTDLQHLSSIEKIYLDVVWMWSM